MDPERSTWKMKDQPNTTPTPAPIPICSVAVTAEILLEMGIKPMETTIARPPENHHTNSLTQFHRRNINIDVNALLKATAEVQDRLLLAEYRVELLLRSTHTRTTKLDESLTQQPESGQTTPQEPKGSTSSKDGDK